MDTGKKALVVASVASMISQFNMPFIKMLQESGYEVHIACNFKQGNTCDRKQIIHLQKELEESGAVYFQVDFCRNVARVDKNLKAYCQMKKILKENKYKLVHCHSPIGGMAGRVAAKKYRKRGLKVIYTAHGFHFYKGAPLLNWFLFYPVEWLLSYWTDVLITINKEDYKRAKRSLHAKRTEYVHGVGINVSKFRDGKIDICKKRRSLNLKKDDVMLFSVGELNENKNHSVVIHALAEMNNPQIHYFIAGSGRLKEKLGQLSEKLGIEKQIHLLGYRNDIRQLLQIADIYLLPSRREGLNVSLMEAMASGVPCIVSRIRGNVDLIANSKYLVAADDVEGWEHAVKNMVICIQGGDMSFVETNRKRIQQYAASIVNEQMKKIYLSDEVKNYDL